MAPRAHLAYPTVAVLQALAHGYHYGFDIMDITELPSGTVYPILRRLEQTRMVRSTWERVEIARREQRPARRYYELTGAGEKTLAEAAKRYRALARLSSPTSRKTKPARAYG
jgi:DNA-binding PadR family transcriptional regulator